MQDKVITIIILNIFEAKHEDYFQIFEVALSRKDRASYDKTFLF